MLDSIDGEKMKKSRIISVVVITTIMVFAAGFYSGMHYDFPFTHWSTSSLKDNIAEANETLILLAQLDNNKMEAIYELSKGKV